ncbi:MAG: MFS transporter [Thermodesulfobacteriota bacterium]|jgi:MFS family permease
MRLFRRLAADLHTHVLAISVMTLVIMMGSSVISPVLPLLAQEFGVSYAGAGALVSAFAVGRIPFDFIGGALVDRLSPRAIASGGAAIVTLSAVLSACADSFAALLWYRLLGGVGSALFVITAMALLARTVDPQRMGQAMSFYQSMLLLGVSAGPSVGGFAANLFHSLHAPFWAMAVLSLIVTVMCLRWIGEFPTSPAAPQAAVPAQVATNTPLTHLFSDPTFRFVCVLTFLIFAIRSGLMLNLMPLFAQATLGLSETGIGVIQSLSSLANFCILWHAGRLLDQVGRRRVTLPSLWATAVVVLLFPWATALVPLIGASVAFGIVIGYLGPAPAAIIADIAPKEAAGTVMGIYRMAGDIGLLVGPIAVGWAAGHLGFGVAFATVAGCTALVALTGTGVRETLLPREVHTPAPLAAEEPAASGPLSPRPQGRSLSQAQSVGGEAPDNNAQEVAS